VAEKISPTAGDGRAKAVPERQQALYVASAEESQAQKHGEVTFVDRHAERAWREAWANLRAWLAAGWRP
jgi:hypothetical protein